MGPYYISTPIYYVNAEPTIGHCYTTIVADVAARFQRLIRGSSGPGTKDNPGVFFLTGTDEHADKVVSAAAEAGVSPLEHADRLADAFRDAFAKMGCSHDDFIRTTEPRHTALVPGYIRTMRDAGDVYLGDYEGWYDPGQEQYVTETEAKDSDFKSPITGRPLVKRTEKNYFFRLSKYADWLGEHIESHPRFILPEARRNEVLGRIRSGLQDVPISRAVQPGDADWGILMPDDPDHRIYVWIDALFNYLTAVDTPGRRFLWPPSVHLVGKDILWFHAVIWPCMLRALGREQPGTIYAHSWWISEGQKMSKSLGNFIDLDRLLAYADRYSLDALRYFLLTQGPLGATDADFSYARFVETYNADLANGIGNSVSRVGNMIVKYLGGQVGEPSKEWNATFLVGQQPWTGSAPWVTGDWQSSTFQCVHSARRKCDDFRLCDALEFGIELVQQVDGYINATRPFQLAKESPRERFEAVTDLKNRDALATILWQCAEALRIASLLLWPAMPDKMAQIWRNWNCSPLNDDGSFEAPLSELAQWAGPHSLKPGTKIIKGDPLFMRADPKQPAP